MTDEKKPRATSQPAADSFAADDASQFTPVTDVLELLDAEIVLTERERRMFFYLWKHSANQEMRGRKRSDSQDTSLLAKRLDEIDDKHTRLDVDLRGDGNREHGRVATLERFHARIVKWALGSLVAIAGAAISFGIWMGSVRTDIDNLKQRAQPSQRWRSFLPDSSASPDSKEPTP
ncbi:MAG TPA: hypothetical protein VFV99_32335 [Kofleriaceae bacterium]|nr:hypothetical protein [Kofleriaceae bacterium]